MPTPFNIATLHKPSIFAISTGDPSGVGPQITVQAIQALVRSTSQAMRALMHFHIFGDKNWLAKRLDALIQGSDLTITLTHTGTWTPQILNQHTPSVNGGLLQIQTLTQATHAVLSKQASALITAPMSKYAVTLAAQANATTIETKGSYVAFTGHTEFLARAASLSSDDVTMAFVGPNLITTLVTTHLPMTDLPKGITQKRILRTIEHTIQLLQFKQDSHAPSKTKRIVVTGLNPHAGENSTLGKEEATTIAPAIKSMQHKLPKGFILQGPIGAETAFRMAQANECDAVVAMYHDQATIASKLLDWKHAVNTTLGLPFIRTSVDHGVAYEAAQRFQQGNMHAIDPSGMIAAINLAITLSKNAS